MLWVKYQNSQERKKRNLLLHNPHSLYIKYRIFQNVINLKQHELTERIHLTHYLHETAKLN